MKWIAIICLALLSSISIWSLSKEIKFYQAFLIEIIILMNATFMAGLEV